MAKELTALECVTEINDALLLIVGKLEEDGGIDVARDYSLWLELEYTTNGLWEGVKFLGIPLWSDADDDRPYDASDIEKIPLKEHLTREVKRILTMFSLTNIKFSSGVDHSDHGRGDGTSGPENCDCVCRKSDLEAECASDGCGFCHTN